MAHKRDITAGNILASAAAGVASTFTLASFGATGSMIGAALGPVIFLIVKEFTRGPADSAAKRRVPAPPLATGRPDPGIPPPVRRTPFTLLRRNRGRAIAVTGVLATVLTVGAITLPELLLGGSIVSDRRTTILSPASSSGASTTPADAEPADVPATEPAGGGETTEPAQENVTPADPGTTQTTTEPPPATTAPAAPPAVDPSATPQAPPTDPAPAPDPSAPSSAAPPADGTAPAVQ